MPAPWPLRRRTIRDPQLLIDDPRVEGWDPVSTFGELDVAVAWRDQLRALGIDAVCVADHPLDRHGHGDIWLVVPPGQWSRATEIVDNLE